MVHQAENLSPSPRNNFDKFPAIPGQEGLDDEQEFLWQQGASYLRTLHKSFQRVGTRVFPDVARKRIASLLMINDLSENIVDDFSTEDRRTLMSSTPPDAWLYRFLANKWKSSLSDEPTLAAAPETIAQLVMNRWDMNSQEFPNLAARVLCSKGLTPIQVSNLIGKTLVTPYPYDELNTFLDPEKMPNGQKCFALRWSGRSPDGVSQVRQLQREVQEAREGKNNRKLFKRPVRITSWLIAQPRHLDSIIGINPEDLKNNGGYYYSNINVPDIIQHQNEINSHILQLSPFEDLMRIASHNIVQSTPGIERFIEHGKLAPLGIALVPKKVFFQHK